MEETVAIDGAGRIVVPKALRKRLGLFAGARLRVREEGGRLVLEPLEEHVAPLETDGLLVIRGRIVGEIPDPSELRTRRIRAIGSGK